MRATIKQKARVADATLERVEEIRRFNRFYTREIGVLEPGHLDSEFSLAEVRVMYELAHWSDAGRTAPTATELCRALGLDAGYLSRLLSALERRRLIKKTASPEDRRRHHLQLTAHGRAVSADLEDRARASIATMLAPLSDRKQRLAVDALRTAQSVLTADPGGLKAAADESKFIVRAPRAGDLGWVVQRHGGLYAREYGWNEHFEALVARIVADYVDHFDPAREACWIAERDGENVGCVFLVQHPDRSGVAKLRLLLVEPSARGLGIGRRLVEECTRFARESGYHKIMLWTNNVLTSALRIYEAAGYKLVEEKPHRSFGPELVGQTWELAL